MILLGSDQWLSMQPWLISTIVLDDMRIVNFVHVASHYGHRGRINQRRERPSARWMRCHQTQVGSVAREVVTLLLSNPKRRYQVSHYSGLSTYIICERMLTDMARLHASWYTVSRGLHRERHDFSYNIGWLQPAAIVSTSHDPEQPFGNRTCWCLAKKLWLKELEHKYSSRQQLPYRIRQLYLLITTAEVKRKCGTTQ